MTFDPLAICRILNEEQVDYVVVGGFATVIHGSPLPTDFGIVDLAFAPSGPLEGFDEWNDHASSTEIADGLSIRIAALDDIIASKEAAAREKDLFALPYLGSLRDVIHGDEA